jgi:hypothetical protein
MTEAWLLFDEKALREAAGNPRGDHRLGFPPVSSLESVPDPKQTLHDLLRTASGRAGRRLKQFKGTDAVRRLAELINDFSPLRALTAFQALEEEIRQVIEAEGWLDRIAESR